MIPNTVEMNCKTCKMKTVHEYMGGCAKHGSMHAEITFQCAVCKHKVTATIPLAHFLGIEKEELKNFVIKEEGSHA